MAQEIPKNVRPGSRWSDEENTRLLQELQDRQPYDQIAKSHGRTPNAIEKRAQVIALGLKRGGKSEVQIAEELGRGLPEIIKMVTVREPAALINVPPKPPKNTTPAAANSADIFKLLEQINEKIDKLTQLIADKK